MTGRVATGSAIDRHKLGSALSAGVAGDVWFDGGHRAAYATDSSNYRHVPIGVVCPRDEQDLLAALAICAEHEAPVVARGGGTSLAGQACNEAVVLDTSRHLDAVLDLDVANRRAVVQPGVVLDDLRRLAGSAGGLTFGPDPATHAWCTLGGMIGNNSCGTHALYTGKTVDNVESLRIATYGGSVLDVGECGPGGLAARASRPGEEGRIHAALASLADRYGDLVRRRYPQIPRRVSGYNLDELLPERGEHVARALVGTESTCVLVLRATLALATSPRHRRLVVLGFPDIYSAADHVPDLLGFELLGLEGFDSVLIEHMRAARLNLDALPLLPPGGGWLLAEVGADEESEAQARAAALAAAAPGGAVPAIFTGAAEQAAVWRIRESGLGATARPPGQRPNHEGWEDAAVAPERLGEYLRGVAGLWRRFGYSGAWYGHFGQGCVHTRNDFDFSSSEGLATFRRYIEAAAELCVSLGGSLSGEHGDGQARGELLEKMFGAELVDAFRQFKAVFDPSNKMNPGRVVDAVPLDVSLRHGPDHHPASLGRIRFALSGDHGSLAEAASRCVGVGRCRRDDTGVMCPSYRATRDEVHSTRGRAKLLEELFRGEVTPATWRNRDVLAALDLCLSCKGCAVDCPTSVDMATYKAEFLSHYYAGRLRPRDAYALSLLPWWGRVASKVPRLANALVGDHVLGRLLRSAAGISPRRSPPRFVPTTLRASLRTRSRELEKIGREEAIARRFVARGLRPAGGGGATDPDGPAAAPRRSGGTAPVALQAGDALPSAPARRELPTVAVFADTFTDLFQPQRALAAIELLEAAGEQVAVPRAWACCGRPLYDSGMLDLARHALRRLLAVLDAYLDHGIPIVVLEPSCLAAFRDELPGLLAGDERAHRLAASVRTLAEHLEASGWQPQRRLGGLPVTLHPHCHQRAAGGVGAERAVLERAGCTVRVLDAGCCGLAGSFGFRKEHDELSRRIAAQRFLPELASAPDGGAVVIDGFSCATQAAHLGVPDGTTTLAELLVRTIDR